MKIAIIPSDIGACCFYRVAWPGMAVANATGWHVDLYHPGQVSLSESGLQIIGVNNPDTYDLVVVQRIMSPRQVRMIEAFQMMGVAVVVDVDDAIWRIPRANTAHEGWNEVVEGKRRFEWLDEACARADLVTVSTSALAARYGPHGRVEVLRNGLPDVAFAKDAKTGFQGRVKIGWAGSVDTHPGDLEIMGSAVADIIRDNDDVDLHVVGYPERVAEVLGVPSDRVTGTDWVPFDKYHEALQGIDVMFVPLADTLFNQAKSALKAQEAAAAGCLVVASATPENERLYALGGFVGGTLGSDDNHLWGEALDIGIDAIRKGFTGKPERARFLSYEERAVRWADAWKGAVERRRLMNR